MAKVATSPRALVATAPTSLADAVRHALERTDDERLREWLERLLTGNEAKGEPSESPAK